MLAQSPRCAGDAEMRNIMSLKSDSARKLFSMGYNCSQSVSAVFADDYGVGQNEILKIACGFGGGMRNSEVCGAVTGAIMVIGMKYGNGIENSPENKSLCYQKTLEFTKKFTDTKKSIVCRELLGIDIFQGDGMQRALERNLFQTTCVDMIIHAVILLEELGY